MKTKKSQFLFLLLGSMLCNINVLANETIKFTCQVASEANTQKYFSIAATNGKQFTVDWGDDSGIETITGIGNLSEIGHTYTYNIDTDDYTVIITGVTEDCLFTDFACTSSQLIDLDLSKAISLTFLDCINNQLTELDLCANTELKYLVCSYNQLTNLDLRANAKLLDLSCSSNLFSGLNLSGCTALQHLSCCNSPLSTLDLSGCTALRYLYCYNNRLTDLDLRTNTKLQSLGCYENLLTGLDLRANTQLQSLGCYNNQITVLELNANTQLQVLVCYNNNLQLTDLYAASKKISEQNNKLLGMQILSPWEVTAGIPIDYSTQREFGGVATSFTVEKNDLPAPSIDYTISNGIITFNNTGIYTVSMTNSAIVSHENHPARVIIEFDVAENTDIANSAAGAISIYPNPTSGRLTIVHKQTAFGQNQLSIGDIAIFDTMGKKQLSIANWLRPNAVCPLSIHQIDISHLPAGTYYLQAAGEVKKIVKK